MPLYNISSYMIKEIILLLLVAFLAVTDPLQTPIIGIYTQRYITTSSGEIQTLNLKLDKSTNYSYIAASYVKFIQMSGAQVVPVFSYTKDKAYFDNLLPQLNGILFPGGADIININNIWTKNADYILKYAIEQNRNGTVFPVWGTCRGWELLAYLTSGYDSNVLSPVKNETNIKNIISISEPTYLFSELSQKLKTSLESGAGILFFDHKCAVSTAYYESNEIFKNFWNITSTTTSSYSETFISGAESKEFPIYAVQFHPEKNPFQWKVDPDRSYNGIEIAHILSNRFIEKARASKNIFNPPEAFYNVSIYNYKTQSTQKKFTQVYTFNETIPSGESSIQQAGQICIK